MFEVKEKKKLFFNVTEFCKSVILILPEISGNSFNIVKICGLRMLRKIFPLNSKLIYQIEIGWNSPLLTPNYSYVRSTYLLFRIYLQGWAQPRKAVDFLYLGVPAWLVPNQWKYCHEVLLEIAHVLFRGYKVL